MKGGNIMATKPKPYNMSNFEDIERWFREMEGYLKTSDFVNQGTDLEGRKYAFEAFIQFKRQFSASMPFFKTTMEKVKKKKFKKPLKGNPPYT